MKKVIVIGGGPAGAIAAGFAGQNGHSVTLFEKNYNFGRKLLITGKGRCNVTNAIDSEGLIENTPGNPYFLYSAFYTFDSNRTIEFFENLGVSLKIERGRRVFPVSDDSSHIVRALEKFMSDNNVEVKLNTKVQGLIFESNKVIGITVDGEEYLADVVIIATGGLSYPITGCTGDGYRFAKSVGHKVTKCYPSLVPLKIAETWCTELQGLSLKNVEITLKLKGKVLYKNIGEMMFTHFGVTGPLVLRASRFIADKMNEKATISIDLKPALSEKELDLRVLKDFEKYKNKAFRNGLDDLLPQRLIPTVIKLTGIDEKKKVNSMTKDERRKLVQLIKSIDLTVIGNIGYPGAVVTTGGIDVSQIDPSTMRSKIVENLSFAGEVIDVDSFTGGFNLQIAFATGYLAGSSI